MHGQHPNTSDVARDMETWIFLANASDLGQSPNACPSQRVGPTDPQVTRLTRTARPRYHASYVKSFDKTERHNMLNGENVAVQS